MRQRHRGRVLAAALTLLTAGCGFQLRGSFSLPPWLHDVEVRSEQPADPVAAELRRNLQNNAISLRAAGATAGARIQLAAEKFNRRLLATGSGNQKKDYEFTYEISVTVVDPEGKTRLTDEHISVQREMDYDETRVLAKAAEQDKLKADMIKEAARQIMRRLQARSLQ